MRGRMGSTCRKARGTESGRPLTSRIASASVSCTTRYHAPRRSGQVARARNRAHCCTWFMHALQSVRSRQQLLGRPPRAPPREHVAVHHRVAVPRNTVMRDTTAALRHGDVGRSEEHTSELQSRLHLVCRLLLEKKKNKSEWHRY